MAEFLHRRRVSFSAHLAFLLLSSSLMVSHAQTEPFALPSHAGAMLLDLEGLRISEASAKPGGNEIGIRAHDAGHTEMLAFLFLTPNFPTQSAASCLKQDLDQLKKDSAGRNTFTSQPYPDDVDTAESATLLITYGNSSQQLHKYAGAGDQCFAVEVYPDKNTKLDLGAARALLVRQGYDPHYQPSSTDQYTYANILYRTRQYRASIPVYDSFLASVPKGKETIVSRRVATDNLGLALARSGDIDAALKLLTDAAHHDSAYPRYYYNLACTDAEGGDAERARVHLQQAFERRSHMPPGEAFPDPTTDESLLKLKDNKAFWDFVQSLR